MKRWWIYQRERFPVLAHGPLILAFSVCAVCFSSLLRGDRHPPLAAFVVAFGVCFLMFLQLRVADEFKDAEDDARWRPYRPVPRGLIKLSELRIVFLLAAVAQAALAYSLNSRLLIPLSVAWTYLALMSVEFFCRDWLKRRPVVYLLTHMGIMPLVDFFGTACEWMPGSAPQGLFWFLTASFCNGVVIETGRKLRQPDAEEEGVETYSKLWGLGGGTAVWLASLAATFFCAVMAARRIHFATPIGLALGVLLVLAVWLGSTYVKRGMPGKKMEAFSGLWTLTLYLMLGIVPFLLS